MAYSNDIDALSPDHRWAFSGNSFDFIGSANGTDTSITHNATSLCEDVTGSAQTNALTDRVTIANQTDMNNSAHDERCIAGWFMVDDINQPPTRVYGEGAADPCMHIVVAYGNNIMFESVPGAGNNVQVYGDTFMTSSRPYHLCMRFSGNALNNEFTAFVDGVECLISSPSDREPDVASYQTAGAVEFGDPAGAVGVGGDTVILQAARNGYYNQWASWSSGLPTNSQIRTELFEKGATANLIISSSATEAEMQAQLDLLSGSLQPDWPLCIRVEPLSGGGNFQLDAQSITFDPLASIHMQYTGVDTLTWRNDLYSNMAITSSISGGLVDVQNETTLTINGLQNPSEIRLLDPSDSSIITGAENVTSGVYTASLYETVADIVIASLDYKILRIGGQDLSENIAIQVTQELDRIYNNP